MLFEVLLIHVVSVLRSHIKLNQLKDEATPQLTSMQYPNYLFYLSNTRVMNFDPKKSLLYKCSSRDKVPIFNPHSLWLKNCLLSRKLMVKPLVHMLEFNFENFNNCLCYMSYLSPLLEG